MPIIDLVCSYSEALIVYRNYIVINIMLSVLFPHSIGSDAPVHHKIISVVRQSFSWFFVRECKNVNLRYGKIMYTYIGNFDYLRSRKTGFK